MISSEESEKLKEFRETLPKNIWKPDLFEDDYFLIRWLRARQMNVEKACEMLIKSLKWREEMHADTILEKEDISDKYKKMYPTGLLGRDEEDCIGILLPLGRFNHRILFGENTMETALKFNMIWVEKMMRLVKETEKATGKKGLRFVEVVDMEHYSYKELTFAPSREFIIKTNKNFDENYPEMLKSCIVINAPKIFTLLFNFVRPFMSKETISKVSVYGGGPQNEEIWKNVLRSKFKPENIPRRWGGSRDGSDEFCCDDPEVWIGAPIPLSFFKTDEIGSLQHCVKISARDSLKVDFPIKLTQDGCPRLHWLLNVESHDIGFSITFQGTDPKEEPEVIVPIKRYESKQGLQEGSHPHSSRSREGVYVITFDNKYSLTRSKTVHYSIQLSYAQDLLPKAIPEDTGELEIIESEKNN